MHDFVNLVQRAWNLICSTFAILNIIIDKSNKGWKRQFLL